MKPYQTIPIQECYEPLVEIPRDIFVLPSPPPYQQLGANYGDKSPYYLRQGVLNALRQAQSFLQQDYPHWRILVFDAYRPVEVQQFMVDYTFAQILKGQNLAPQSLTQGEVGSIYRRVYQIWAIPSLDPATPPPHSTGAAVDVTLINAAGAILDMGGEIDELSERSHPDYYADLQTTEAQMYQQRRQLLDKVMTKAGFRRHFGEWWHFSLGDQLWAWLCRQQDPSRDFHAYYGRV